ncbi:MAG: EamA family transporter [Saccharospirillaceae bacterium]|nr:EamA family transporter [Pseudomonadales bacterium]NRB80092.1 EamA family transporter [Saccharospirillaceae bacterium]
MNSINPFKLFFIIMITLIAFAANSVLCRYALKVDELGVNSIDPASFTSIRIISGAVLLAFIFWVKSLKSGTQADYKKPKWRSAIFLFIYAAAFSFGYISQDTGVGALILFGSVQISMISIHFIMGQRLKLLEWIGIGLAFVGLVYLIYPDLSSPSLIGAILMSLSGIAWALYSVNGMGSTDPINDTAINFIRAAIFAVLLLAVSLSPLTLLGSGVAIEMSQTGILLAIVSGTLASGAGYTIWYKVLKHISVTQASVLQLSVPIIAALGGLLFTSEPLTLRFIIASVSILGGILLVLLAKQKKKIAR